MANEATRLLQQGEWLSLMMDTMQRTTMSPLSTQLFHQINGVISNGMEQLSRPRTQTGRCPTVNLGNGQMVKRLIQWSAAF